MAIPTDEVDPELIAQPTRWDLGFIRKFMMVFGPISSIFDFVTFGVMLWVFHAGEALFQTGWFVESLATQTLVIFVIRTRRVPFFRSRPSAQLPGADRGWQVLVLPLLPGPGHASATAPDPGRRVRRRAARFAAHTLHPAHSDDAAPGPLVRPGGTAPSG